MIHQLIFAYPRPGMTEDEFHHYWTDVHAVRYASKIPQIKRYAVDTRVPLPSDEGEPLWSGIAEIWLRNETEQLESLQTQEFLEGARADEPRWAAFWRTLVLDTDAHVLVEGGPQRADDQEIKLFILVKRKEGMSLGEFRRRSLSVHAPLVGKIPCLRRYYQGHVRDALYGVGEAVLDAVYQLWFDSPSALEEAQRGMEYRAVRADFDNFVNLRYVHTMAVRQNWIIGPELRQ